MADIELNNVDIHDFTYRSAQLDVLFVSFTVWLFVDFLKKTYDMCKEKKTHTWGRQGRHGSKQPESVYVRHGENNGEV